MVFWKSIAIALVVILGLSYAGFAYVYNRAGGINFTGIVTGEPQPKVVTVLKNQNLTFERVPGRETSPFFSVLKYSIDVVGYKTGFLYYNVSQFGVMPGWHEGHVYLYYEFETDGFFTGLKDYQFEHNLIGTRMWLALTATTASWAVISISLYLRD